MSKKMMLLATALTALAFAALPAVASAGTPETHCSGSPSPTCEIEISGGAAELTRTANALKIQCSSMTGTGVMSTTGGSIALTFHGCKESLFKTTCSTSSTSAPGTIVVTNLPYDNIYTTDNKTSPGVLVTPTASTSHFASFTCINGSHTVSGNGVIGSLSAPKCGEAAASLTLGFTQASQGHQTHKQITGTGTIYDLEEGGSTAAQVGSGTVKVTGGTPGSISVTCP
jgi:hypothetical protein